MKKTKTVLKILCPTCVRKTSHSVVKFTKHESNDGTVHNIDTYQIIKCNGCESHSFRQIHEDDAQYDFKSSEYYAIDILYPERNEDTLQKRYFFKAPPALNKIYNETIEAFNKGLSLLCSAGIRATLESVCNSENIKSGFVQKMKNGVWVVKRETNLEGKINGLNEVHLLTSTQVQVLHELRFIGNNAVHQITAPTTDSLKSAIEIIDYLLNTIYELKYKGDQIKRRRLYKESSDSKNKIDLSEDI